MVMGPQAPAFANNYVQFPVFFTLRILATFTFFFARIKHHRNRIAIPFFFDTPWWHGRFRIVEKCDTKFHDNIALLPRILCFIVYI
jgi:hypothetical protein